MERLVQIVAIIAVEIVYITFLAIQSTDTVMMDVPRDI